MTVPRRRMARPPHGSERARRDPRAERAGAEAAAGERAESAPRARLDPRAVRDGAAVVNGRLRLDRARPLHVVRDRREAAATRHDADAGPRLVRIPEPSCSVLAVPDRADGRLSRHDRETLGAARTLADAHAGAVVALAWGEADELGAAGADRVVRCDADEAYAPELRAAAVLAAARELDARHVVLPDAAQGGGDVGRRVAAALGETPAANVVALAAERVVSRGDGGRGDFERAPPRVILAAAGSAEPVTETRHEALPMPAPMPAGERSEPRIVDLGLLEVDPASIPLAEAGLILSAGAGVEDWDTFHALAAALGATEGASRVVCDAGALPRDRQVGASGTLVSARGYVALGISGAPQHLEGIKSCECVIAVNTDPHAEIVKRADLAVIGDVHEIMPALLRELESRARDGA